MKKLLWLMWLLPVLLSAQATDLFISEYCEGSSNNKYIEIYNGTGASVNLGNYKVWKIANSGPWQGSNCSELELSGTLADNEVFVIYNSASSAEIIAQGDLTWSQCNFNGNDAVGLVKNIGGTWTVIDAVGEPVETAITDGWDVAGTTTATKDHTLVRKPAIHTPTTDWAASAGTSVDDSQWIVYPQNTFTFLGSHTMSTEANPILTPTAGTSWQRGTTQDITWTTSFFAGNVTITLNIGDIVAQTIATGVANNGTYSWAIPASIAPANNYTMTIAQGATTYTSSSFSITAPTVDTGVLISEIMYDPSDSAGYADAGYEFVELYNGAAQTVSLANWTLTAGSVNYTFAAGTQIAAGQYLVVAANVQNIQTLYGLTGVLGPWTGNLDNAADTITLGTDAGAIADIVHYTNASPWPTGASDNGPSIELKTLTVDNNQGANWQASYEAHGTPGLVNSTAPVVVADVIINEIMYNPSATLGPDDYYEYLELYNRTSAAVDLSNWTLAQGLTFTFPSGASIAAHGYLVIAKNVDSLATHYNLTGVQGPWTGSLNNTGELINLVNAAGTVVNGVNYLPTDPWPTSPNGSGPSLELISPDLDNTLPASWQASAMANGTPGAQNSTNSGPQTVTIHDIQYTTDASGNSPLLGQSVRVSGVVTGVIAGNFFLQDGTGAWNGVVVYTTAVTPTVGQQITLTAVVSEYYNKTELTGVSDVVQGATVELPAAVEVSTGALADEQYEGVLVRIADAACTSAPNEFGEWQVDDGSGAITVDDTGYAYTPTVGTHYSVTGPCDYSYNVFRIIPRSDADISVVDAAQDQTQAQARVLTSRNYPNPFNPSTTISFDLPQAGHTQVKVFDVRGRLVKTLADNTMNTGHQTLTWNGTDNNGNNVAGGVYFYRVNGAGQTVTKKMVMIK